MEPAVRLRIPDARLLIPDARLRILGWQRARHVCGAICITKRRRPAARHRLRNHWRIIDNPRLPI
jgi:hypothetical protein